MQILVLLNFAAALQGFFLTYLIAQNKPRDKRSCVLGLLTFVLSLSLLGGVYGLSGYYKVFPHFTNVADPLFLLYGPLLFVYIYVLTHNHLPKYYFLHAFPFLIYVFAFIPLYLKSGEEKIQFVEAIFLNDHVPLKALLMQLGRVIHISIYIVVSLGLVRTYQQKIKDNFSDIEKISLEQAKRLLYLFLLVLLGALVAFVLGYFLSYSFSISNNIIGLFVGVLIYALAYSTWNKQHVHLGKTVGKPSAPDLSEEKTTLAEEFDKQKGRRVLVLSEEQFHDFSKRLERAVEQEKLFIENEISLAELSKKIAIQPYQLSELISRLYGESFFDFINRHRIEEIKSRLQDPESETFSLLGIAMDCGFNSKSSFNTAFKKFTGQTPSEYRKKERLRSTT